MTDWTKTYPCKQCNVRPNASCDLEWIKLSCPICGIKSITTIKSGTEWAIEFWNKYYGIELYNHSK